MMGDAAGPLWALLESYLAAEGVELDDLEVTGTGAGKTVRITVDAVGGIDIDRIAELSRGIGPMLDEHADLGASYLLEVTTPGLERSLRRPAHFAKSVDREVVVKTEAPVAGAKSHRGVLAKVDENGITVQTAADARRLEFGEISAARTVFRWEAAAKPGKRR
jgi:ribosome maturation factor RimP